MINKNIIKKIGSPKIFVFTVIWLMVLVFVGTIVQKNIGLYAAQQQYFSSWFKFLGPFPLPSGKLTMLLMFLNLSCYFFRPHIFSINKESKYKYLVTLKTGKNREIRRIFEYNNIKITNLKRISIGKHSLGNMKIGELVEIII